MDFAGNADGAQLRANGSPYRRREPEGTLLHATVRAHLKTFLAQVEQRGDGAGYRVSWAPISSAPWLAASSPPASPACAAHRAATRCWSRSRARAAVSALLARPDACK